MATDRQTDVQMDRTDSLSRSRCRERRLQCETQTLPAAALHGGTSNHCAGPGETTIKMRVAVPETDLRPCGKLQPNPFSSFAGHASKQTDSETENMSMSMNMSINTGRSALSALRSLHATATKPHSEMASKALSYHPSELGDPFDP